MNNHDDIDEQYEEAMRGFKLKFGCTKSVRIKELLGQMESKKKLEDRRRIKREIIFTIRS